MLNIISIRSNCRIEIISAEKQPRQGMSAPVVRLNVKRSISLAIIVVVVPLGVGTKLYGGPLDAWVTRYGGDVAVPVFFFYLAMLARPRLSPRACAVGVFVVCSAVELSQILDSSALSSIRGNVAGRTVLGSDFDPLDFVFYAVGALAAVVLYRLLRCRGATNS